MGFGVFLKIDVVQETGYPPQVRIFTEKLGIPVHGCSNHERMVSLVFVLNMFVEKNVRFIYSWKGHSHLINFHEDSFGGHGRI